MKTIVYVVRDTGLGGINSVVRSLSEGFSDVGSDVRIVSLSEEKDINVFQGVKGVLYFPVVNSVSGFLTRVLNKIFPYIFTRIFAKRNARHLISYLDGILGNDYKVFLCGFGTFSIVDAKYDPRLYVVSHSINSEMLKRRVPKYLYKPNLKLLSSMVGERFICVSNSIKNDWHRLLVGKPWHIEVINNPVAFKNVLVEPITLRHEYFLYCGRLSVEKNIFSIIDAYLKSEVPEDLVILGDGPLLSQLENYIKDKGLGDKIHLQGFVDNPLQYMAGAKALLLNSFYEGLPTVALESMWVKTPLVIGECAGAAYDVVPKSAQGEIFKTDDILSFAEKIKDVSDGVYGAFHFDQSDWSLGKAVRKYEEF